MGRLHSGIESPHDLLASAGSDAYDSLRAMPVADFFRALRTAFMQAIGNDVLDDAKAAAYSGMLMLFPGFLVLTTMLALVPVGSTLLDELRNASEQFLPADTMSLLQSYFQTRKAFSVQVLLSATTLSIFAAWGVTSTLMDGFRRAYRLPPKSWSYWQQRIRALLLVPIALVPLSMATFLVIFGKPIEDWMGSHSQHELHAVVLLLWRLARWLLALVTSTAVVGGIYHFGTNSREHWTRVAPGAVTATLLWFPVTLAFGVYVTRVSDYTIIYGSLGTSIATLVWLYLTSFSVLLGAQLNGELYRQRRRRAVALRAQARLSEANAAEGQSGQIAKSESGMVV
jgi:membrane protein